MAAADLLQEQPADWRRWGPHVCHIRLQQQDWFSAEQEGSTAIAQETHWRSGDSCTKMASALSVARLKFDLCTQFQRRAAWRAPGWCATTLYRHRERCKHLSSHQQSSERTDQQNTYQTQTQNRDQRTTTYISECENTHTQSLWLEEKCSIASRAAKEGTCVFKVLRCRCHGLVSRRWRRWPERTGQAWTTSSHAATRVSDRLCKHGFRNRGFVMISCLMSEKLMSHLLFHSR